MPRVKAAAPKRNAAAAATPEEAVPVDEANVSHTASAPPAAKRGHKSAQPPPIPKLRPLRRGVPVESIVPGERWVRIGQLPVRAKKNAGSVTVNGQLAADATNAQLTETDGQGCGYTPHDGAQLVGAVLNRDAAVVVTRVELGIAQLGELPSTLWLLAHVEEDAVPEAVEAATLTQCAAAALPFAVAVMTDEGRVVGEGTCSYGIPLALLVGESESALQGALVGVAQGDGWWRLQLEVSLLRGEWPLVLGTLRNGLGRSWIQAATQPHVEAEPLCVDDVLHAARGHDSTLSEVEQVRMMEGKMRMCWQG